MPAAHPPPPAAPAVDTIGAILAGRLVRPLFQPIVDLDSGGVVGLEALARGPAGSALEFPDRLFGAAVEAGLLGPLDLLCGERALEEAASVTAAPPLLFINAEPAVMDQPLSPRLRELFMADLRFRHVLEFTERALTAVPGSLLAIAAGVQDLGNAVALDDVGVDPVSLALLPVLEPEVIKLDMSLVRDPAAATTRAVCAVVRAEARRTGAMIIAEGIETQDDLRSAREMGAHWGQGWLFGRPEPIGQADPRRYDPVAADRLRAPRPGFLRSAGTPFDLARAHRPATGAAGLPAALDRLRHLVAADRNAVVIASGPVPGLDAVAELGELAGRTRSVIVLDQPIPGEFAIAVIGAGYGSALCVRGGAELVVTDHLPTVAAITRDLLHRQRRRS